MGHSFATSLMTDFVRALLGRRLAQAVVELMLDDLELSYARTLIYTAVTRAQNQV